ncbi:E3 ubiquitin-protein ligase ATL31-like protein, partial [Drosera capensis]
MATDRHGNSITAAATAVNFLVLLAALPLPAASQPTSATSSTDPYSYNPQFSPSIGIIIIILIIALFFMGFFSIYLRHHADSNSFFNHMISSTTAAARSRRSTQRRGLDPETISEFPTFMYEDVKALKIGKGALECAVCLNEFEDEETLTLIPSCDHVFHPECISAWLEGHVTCPVCRADLSKPSQLVSESAPTTITTTQISSYGQDQNQSVHLTENREIDEEAMEMPLRSPEVVELGQRMNRNRTRKDRSGRQRFYGRMNSTGHVAVKQWENMDRFTLRFPVEVRKQVMSGKLTRSTSCLVLREGSGSIRTGVNRAVGPGREGSGRRGGWSDRWSGFFSRWNSMRLGGGGDGSMRSRDDSVHSLRGNVSMGSAVDQGFMMRTQRFEANSMNVEAMMLMDLSKTKRNADKLTECLPALEGFHP